MIVINSHMGVLSETGTFIKSAAALDQFPTADKAEIAILGRSNAGKSSFINSLLKRDIAFVSKTPGKTQLINFFEFGKNCRVVDFPGYGYAQLGRDQSHAWKELVEGYLVSRSNLVGALLLVEIKRELIDDEINLINFLMDRSLPFLVVATKVDKLGKADTENQIKSWQRIIKENWVQAELKVVPVSSHANLGIEALRKLIIKMWVEQWPRRLQ